MLAVLTSGDGLHMSRQAEREESANLFTESDVGATVEEVSASKVRR
jgi:hypothetical protein